MFSIKYRPLILIRPVRQTHNCQTEPLFTLDANYFLRVFVFFFRLTKHSFLRPISLLHIHPRDDRLEDGITRRVPIDCVGPMLYQCWSGACYIPVLFGSPVLFSGTFFGKVICVCNVFSFSQN